MTRYTIWKLKNGETEADILDVPMYRFKRGAFIKAQELVDSGDYDGYTILVRRCTYGKDECIEWRFN